MKPSIKAREGATLAIKQLTQLRLDAVSAGRTELLEGIDKSLLQYREILNG